jgi:hypothetical protein
MAIRALPVIEASFANPSLNKRKRGSSDAPASEPLGSESVLYLLLYLFLLWGRHRDVTQAAQPARAAREPRGCTFAAEQRIKGVAERWAIRMLEALNASTVGCYGSANLALGPPAIYPWT